MSIMSIMSTASTVMHYAMVPVWALAVVQCMHMHIIAARHTSYGWMDDLDELVRMVRYGDAQDPRSLDLSYSG